MKKRMSITAVCAFAIIAFAGCGQFNLGQGTLPPETGEFSGEAGGAQNPSSAEGSAFSQEESDIIRYEQKYYSGEFTPEDYHILADLYGGQGKIRKQRDMLEQCFRLYNDREAFGLLQNLCVNLEEEDAQIRQQVMLLYQNLNTPEYQGEAIHVMESESWFETLMPKLGEGTRNYFLQQKGQPEIFICVGYDEDRKSFSNVWYLENENTLTLLNYSKGVVQLLETTLKDGSYDGDFSLWILDGTSGSILNEQGAFDGGVYSGEYSLKICRKNAAGDPFDLWNNRDSMQYTTYTVQANQQGQGDLEQFAAKLTPYPDFQTYEVESGAAENLSQQTAVETQPEIQVRVFDGEIQVFQNGIWVDMGKLEQYAEQDPFQAYADKKAEQKEEQQLSQESGIDLDQIKLPASSKSGNQKEPVQKPAAPQTPAKQPAVQTPAPQQPQPAAPDNSGSSDDDSDDDGGSGDNSGGGSDNSSSGGGGSGSDDGGSGGGGSSDDGGSDSGSDNETDVEWTPDLM
ncbi:MAG: hypothetical protein NC251_10020 [Lachnoclostridium sp.]|nr:hypothetical protein [Lachnospira sp.]MCM1248752.1 hypothetical protein [Lachnoclostridium sp.]